MGNAAAVTPTRLPNDSSPVPLTSATLFVNRKDDCCCCFCCCFGGRTIIEGCAIASDVPAVTGRTGEILLTLGAVDVGIGAGASRVVFCFTARAGSEVGEVGIEMLNRIFSLWTAEYT